MEPVEGKGINLMSKFLEEILLFKKKSHPIV